MKRGARTLLAFVLGSVLLVGIISAANTDVSAAGNGKGTIGPGNCNNCFPEPEGCSFFECTNRDCNYTCVAEDGSTYSLTRPKTGPKRKPTLF